MACPQCTVDPKSDWFFIIALSVMVSLAVFLSAAVITMALRA